MRTSTIPLHERHKQHVITTAGENFHAFCLKFAFYGSMEAFAFPGRLWQSAIIPRQSWDFIFWTLLHGKMTIQVIWGERLGFASEPRSVQSREPLHVTLNLIQKRVTFLHGNLQRRKCPRYLISKSLMVTMSDPLTCADQSEHFTLLIAEQGISSMSF